MARSVQLAVAIGATATKLEAAAEAGDSYSGNTLLLVNKGSVR